MEEDAMGREGGEEEEDEEEEKEEEEEEILKGRVCEDGVCLGMMVDEERE